MKRCREHRSYDDPSEPCPGQSCMFWRSCPGHDDCFLRRRAIGLPDMIWDEDVFGPEPEMSNHVVTGLEWLTTPEGREWADGFLASREECEPWAPEEDVVVCVEVGGEQMQVSATVLEDHQTTVLVAIDTQPTAVARHQVFGKIKRS